MDGIFDRGLLEKILAFELDVDGVALPFSARLAREQGWSIVFAGRVVDEYRRFIALVMLAGHPVTPSEQVDQAWHLHMVYTESYWHRLCRDTLGRELHHQPTLGGAAENEKFFDWYAKTLESYESIFGAPPPQDIWPLPDDRFASAASGRWVNTVDFWLVPKPRLWKFLSR